VPLPQLCDLLEARWQLRELPAPAEAAYCTQLLVSSAARPHEIGVVGVRQAVGAGTGTGHDGALLEDQDRAARAGKRQDVGDGLHPLCIRHRMSLALEHAEAAPFFSCEPGDERRALGSRAPDLEVRRARTAEGSSAEQRAAKVSGAAAGACDDPARRVFQRAETHAENSGLVQDLQRAFVPGDVQLIPRTAFERSTAVGAYLRRDPEGAEEGKGATCDRGVRDVEMDGNLAATFQVDAAGRVKEPRELRETVAVASRRDCRELVAEVLRE
jgi:hypothetical protein